MSFGDRPAVWGTLAWTGLILALTLRPIPSAIVTPGFCLLCGERGLADALLNVALFVPLGLGGRRLGIGLLAISVSALVLSGAIETVQSFTPGRDPSVGDVLFNGMGAFGGGLLAPRLSSLLAPSGGRAKALCLTWGASFGLGLGLLAWLVGPEVSARPLRLELVPPAPAGGYFQGSILSQTVDQVRVADGVRVDWREDGTGAPSPRIGVQFTNAPWRVAFRPIIGLAGIENRPVLLGPVREDLILRFRRPVDALSLTPIDLRLVDAFAGSRVGDTISASFWREGDAYCLQLDERRECGLGFTVGSGWALLLPTGWGEGGRDRWMDGIWLALLALPLGYWSRAGRATGVAIGLVLLPAAALPATTSLLAAPVYTFGGLALGWTAGRLASRLRGRSLGMRI